MFELLVVRKWKRDGSMNYMSLGAAAENIVSIKARQENHVPHVDPEVRKNVIRCLLLQGQVCETPHAYFRLSSAG